MGITKDRRSKHDRRQLDLGPPNGWLDRRRATERRLPEIAEQEVSDDEWMLYFGSTTRQVTTVSSQGTTTVHEETASEVFARVRDR